MALAIACVLNSGADFLLACAMVGGARVPTWAKWWAPAALAGPADGDEPDPDADEPGDDSDEGDGTDEPTEE